MKNIRKKVYALVFLLTCSLGLCIRSYSTQHAPVPAQKPTAVKKAKGVRSFKDKPYRNMSYRSNLFY